MRLLIPLVGALSACASPQVTSGPAPVRLELPATLESERARYQSDLEVALDRVVAWFAENGLAVGRGELLASAVVFADLADAKRGLAKHYGMAEESIPDGFSGTVDGTTLFVVSRETYAKTWARLFPQHPWSDDSYRGLLTHELAHRAHALKATALFGSEEGMGPRWFFEGLAIACASQFADPPAPALTWDQLEELIAKDSAKPLSYPFYGQMFRSVAASFPVKVLVERAGREGFPATIRRDAPSRAQ